MGTCGAAGLYGKQKWYVEIEVSKHNKKSSEMDKLYILHPKVQIHPLVG